MEYAIKVHHEHDDGLHETELAMSHQQWWNIFATPKVLTFFDRAKAEQEGMKICSRTRPRGCFIWCETVPFKSYLHT